MVERWWLKSILVSFPCETFEGQQDNYLRDERPCKFGKGCESKRGIIRWLHFHGTCNYIGRIDIIVSWNRFLYSLQGDTSLSQYCTVSLNRTGVFWSVGSSSKGGLLSRRILPIRIKSSLLWLLSQIAAIIRFLVVEFRELATVRFHVVDLGKQQIYNSCVLMP